MIITKITVIIIILASTPTHNMVLFIITTHACFVIYCSKSSSCLKLCGFCRSSAGKNRPESDFNDIFRLRHYCYKLWCGLLPIVIELKSYHCSFHLWCKWANATFFMYNSFTKESLAWKRLKSPSYHIALLIKIVFFASSVLVMEGLLRSSLCLQRLQWRMRRLERWRTKLQRSLWRRASEESHSKCFASKHFSYQYSFELKFSLTISFLYHHHLSSLFICCSSFTLNVSSLYFFCLSVVLLRKRWALKHPTRQNCTSRTCVSLRSVCWERLEVVSKWPWTSSTMAALAWPQPSLAPWRVPSPKRCVCVLKCTLSDVCSVCKLFASCNAERSFSRFLFRFLFSYLVCLACCFVSTNVRPHPPTRDTPIILTSSA